MYRVWARLCKAVSLQASWHPQGDWILFGFMERRKNQFTVFRNHRENVKAAETAGG